MLDIASPQSNSAPPHAALLAAPEHHISLCRIFSPRTPLQYLPVLGTIYRPIIGDRISGVWRRSGAIILRSRDGISRSRDGIRRPSGLSGTDGLIWSNAARLGPTA
jgi:hypothetical protein